jgi:hypothetical protein
LNLCLMLLFTVNPKLSVNRQVIHKISEWHHHSVWHGPSKAPSTWVVVHAEKQFLSDSWEVLRVFC